jgi:CheY-like chemotaxis protein
VKPESTVLVADDDEDIREVVAEALTGCGCDVIVASSGRDALAKLHTTEVLPRVILLDLMMPDLDGAQFLAEQRRHPRIADVPVVMITASGRSTRRELGLDVAAWLAKPVELDELLATIAGFCVVPGLDPAGGGPRAVRRVHRFLDRRRRELPSLHGALASGDHEELRHIGHNLKGCGAGFGFPDLSAIGGRLDAAARGKDVDGARAAIGELERFFAEARIETQ